MLLFAERPPNWYPYKEFKDIDEVKTSKLVKASILLYYDRHERIPRMLYYDSYKRNNIMELNFKHIFFTKPIGQKKRPKRVKKTLEGQLSLF